MLLLARLKIVNLYKSYPKKLEQLELARLEKSHPKMCLNKSYLKELELPQLL